MTPKHRKDHVEPAPASLDYTPRGSVDPWRVLAFSDLAGDLGLKPDPDWTGAMEWAHGVIESSPRAWMLARRLYGIVPVIIEPGMDSADVRQWRRSDLQAHLGLTPAQMRAEIEAVAALLARRSEELRPDEEPIPEPLRADDDLFAISQRQLELTDKSLEEIGFPHSIHDYEGATDGDRRAEREELRRRVEEWQQILADPMARILGRQALLNEMLLRRTERFLMRLDPASATFRQTSNTKANLEAAYQRQLLELDEIFPWRGLAGGKVSFRGSIAELIEAVRKVKASADYSLVDGIHTAAEVQILMRQSHQMPQARYRLGQAVHILSAIEGLMDPRWRPFYGERTLKKLDHLGRRLIDEARAAIDEPLPDLMRDGPEGEYEDLPAQPITEPETKE